MDHKVGDMVRLIPGKGYTKINPDWANAEGKVLLAVEEELYGEDNSYYIVDIDGQEIIVHENECEKVVEENR